MRLAALAALLAVAHGTAGPAAAARADWNDGGGPGFDTGLGSADFGTKRAMGPSSQAARTVLRHEASRQAAEAANTVGGGTTTGPGGLRGGGV